MAFSISGNFKLLIIIIVGIISFPAMPSGLISEDQESGETRLSELVKFDVTATTIFSDGVDGWDFFVVGRVNSTTTVRSRLQNSGDTPLSDVEVTCTVYWYDGFYPDRGAVMFKDVILVDVPPGDGALSSQFEFYWVPTFAGAYMLNISAHVPGDAREMSTEPIFFQGLRYEPLPGKYFYTGIWVATEYWDGSSMEGWGNFSLDAPIEEGWDSVEHPLSLTGSSYHSTPYCFWAGNKTTWNVSGYGVHSLITPVMDLTRFDPEPYDVERSIRRPQIFFMYRYRGGMTENASTNIGLLAHYISTDGGESWEPLLDIRDDQVRITGSTGGSVWGYTKRPAYVGEEDMVGIDLGAYQGEKIRIRMDLRLSGMEETGYLLDDFTLIGMDLVETLAFDLIPEETGEIDMDPGSSREFGLRIKPRRTVEPFNVRIECVDASGDIDPDLDVSIEPEIIRFEQDSTEDRSVRIVLNLPENERSGDGSIKLRAAGGGITRDAVFEFGINPRHRIVSNIELPDSTVMDCGEMIPLDLSIRNAGNIIEDVHYSFASDPDIMWSGGRDFIELDPGEETVISGHLSHVEGAHSGIKEGAVVVSLSVLPENAEIIRRLEGDDPDMTWDVHPVNCTVRQYSDMDVAVLTGYREIEDPPQNGTVSVMYELFVMNNGNGRDLVIFSASGPSKGMLIRPVPNVTLDAGASDIVNVRLDLEYPVPMGRYTFNLSAADGNGVVFRTVELVLVIGSTPISSGTFFSNGSLVFEPSDVIRGMETILSFRTQTYGFPENDRFTVGLLVDEAEVASFEFPHSLGEYDDYQITWRFYNAGLHNITLVIYDPTGSDLPLQGLRKRMNTTIRVRYIELLTSEIRLDDLDTGEGIIEIQPGSYTPEAIIWNTGDIDANIAVITLEVVEVDSVTNRSVQSVNVTDIGLGQENLVQFKPVEFLEERTYRITVSIDNKGKWTEDDDNDILSLTLTVGESPPKEPLWKSSWFPLVILGGALFFSAALFLYLMRKKL